MKTWMTALSATALAWACSGCVDAPAAEPETGDGVPVQEMSDEFVRAIARDEMVGRLMAERMRDNIASDAGMPAGAVDAGLLPQCIGSYAEGVTLFTAASPTVLRVHADQPDTVEVSAWPWQIYLGRVRPVYRSVEWHTAGDDLFTVDALPDARNQRVRVTATGDIFDRESREPFLLLRACVRNDCPAAAAEGRCLCPGEVCSAPLIAYAVPRLDGRWDFRQNDLEQGVFDLIQDGRTLTETPFDFPIAIEGRGVNGGDFGTVVQGAISADHQSMSGLIQDEDGRVHGSWSAQRAD